MEHQELDYEKLVSSTKLFGAAEGTARVEVVQTLLLVKNLKLYLLTYFLSDLFHVSECEIDHRDCALLTRHLHRHNRGVHGGLGWLLCLYDF